uniref:Palmitoyltransferase n=1 Tax=Arcella intermedia TaxID=1963864 RepID=A0A6B2LPN9_9EUKA
MFQFLFLGLYTQVSFNDPGRVQGPRLSISEIVEEHLSKGQDITLLDPPASITTLCLVCKIKKPIRSKHCKESGYCIGRFDHYCTWTANAVGYKNHHKFVSVVLLAILNHSCFLYYSSHCMQVAF